MMRRNGGIGKVVAGVIAFFGLVYFIYLYNDLSGQLKNTERSAERYRREQESVSAQLQDHIIAKDQLKQRCDNDKEQMTNRLNSQQQQYKMLKSQHEDMESEFGRLQNEKEKETEEHRKQDEERAIEYNQFKQEKSLEISSLKDTVANLEREKDQLTQQVNGLKAQLQGTLNQVILDKQTISTLQNEVQTQMNQVSQDNQTIASLQNEVQTQKKQLQADRQTIMRNQGLLTYAQDLVQQAQARQQQIEQQYQQLQQQQQQAGAHQGVNIQGAGQQQGISNLQAGNQQGGNMQFGGAGFNPPQQQQQQQAQQHIGGGFLGQGLNQMQGAQGLFQQNLPHKDNILGNLMHGGVGGLNPNVPGGNVAQNHPDTEEGFNIADDVLKSLQDKHKPVDAALLEEQQKQHQIIPPADHNQDTSNMRHDNIDLAALGHQKHGQDMLGQDGHGIQQQQEQHQIMKPNLDNIPRDDSRDNPTRYKVGAADILGEGNHDNRIINQGPVNLQVQEPNLHGEPDNNQVIKGDELQFRPHIPAPDNQIQPHGPVDDSRRQEQLDIPLGQDRIQGDNRDNARLGERNNVDEDDDDDMYEDDYDENDKNEKDEY